MQKFEKILEWMNENGEPMGSRVWGGVHEESDYDFILPQSKKDEMLEVIDHAENISTSKNYENSDLWVDEIVKYDLGDNILLNVMLYEDDKYSKAVQAVSEVTELSNNTDMSYKADRIIACLEIFGKIFDGKPRPKMFLDFSADAGQSMDFDRLDGLKRMRKCEDLDNRDNLFA